MGLGWGSTGRALGALVMAAGSVVAVGGAPAAEAVPPAPRTPPAPTSPPEGVIPDLAARGWQAVFNEEFNGSAVNESVWYVREEDWHGVQARDSLSVSGGQLTVRTYTGADGINRTGTILTGGLGDHTPTWDGFEAAGGYIEARIKLPDGPTTESAFWTMSQNGNNSMPFGDPQADGPEIDIMEHSNGPDSKGDDDGDGDCDFNGQAESYGVPCNELIINNVHWDGFEEDHKSGPGFVENPTATPLQGNFHTYGLLWTPGTPGEYRWYLDGIETNRTTGGVSFTPAQLILTNFVRSGHDYGPLGAATNDQTVVDYVKVWQRPISEIPDQATAASSTLSVPFSVTDRAFGSPANAEPGSVVVTPTASSNTTLVPLANVAVAGNSPADPDGSLTNPGFESGTSGWTLTGGAAVNGTQEHLGTQALQLPQAGGRATQAITGLRPNTTYLVDAHYEIGIGLNDANGNGRADPGETFADPADKVGRFDWGIVDVDATAAGNQALRTSYSRNGTEEQGRPAYWRRQRWPQEVVKFTTGPATTSVTLYVDNQPFAAGGDDSDVSFDSIAVRPLVPHHRTVTVRPADGQVGESTITLTARDGANTVIGTEQFVVRVDAGSLRDGRFEQGDATSAWKILDGASAVHPDPFRADRQLRLAAGTALGTVGQTVTGLEPGVRYKVEATGRVAQSGGDVGVFVQGHGGAQVGTTITSTASTTQSFELVMGAANTTAELLILDWDTADGASYVEGVKLSKCTTPSSCAAVTTTVPSVAAPALGAVGPQSTVSGVPLDVRAQLPAGATLTGVSSTNETLIPTANIATTGTGVQRAFSATAVADRTGKATLRVAYTGATGSPVDIPVVVSEVGLRQPGFEKDGAGWTLTGGATIVTTGQRRGASALQVSGAGDARQKVPPGVIPPGQPLTLGAWVNGTATVTVQTVRPSDTGSDANEQPMVLATANWTGSGYTERQVDLSTLQVTDGNTGRWRGLEVVITDTNTGDGQAVRVDDLHLVHRPVIRRIRDLSLHSGQTAFSYDARRYTTSGRMPANGFWDPTAYTVSTADITGFGTGVLPAANLSALQMNFSGWPYTAFHESRAGTETGRGRVTVQATDAATGRSTSQSYEVTVNAGNNFRHGDFERGTEGALNGGWTHAWMNDSAEIRHRQTWQFLGEKNSGWPLVGPVDFDKALRITSGVVKFTDGTTPLITGLTPGTQYKVKLRAKGNGSLVKVTTHDNVVFAPVLGSVAITPPDSSNVWRDYEVTFTTPASGTGSTSVALYLADDNVSDTTGDGVVDAADAVPASGRYCAQFVAGQTCFDDIGVFKATDVP